MQHLQLYESGVVLEEIVFDLGNSIVEQISAGNERLEGSEKISWNLHSFLTAIQVERDFGKNSNRWRLSHYTTENYNARYDNGAMLLLRDSGIEDQ